MLAKTTSTDSSDQSYRDEPDVDVRAQRFLALLIDLFVLALLSLAVNNTFGVNQPQGGLFVNTVPGTNVAATIVDWPWQLLISFAYFFVQEVPFGTTIGKFILRLRVVKNDGRRITIGAALVRTILRVIDGLPLYYILGGIIVLTNSRRKRLGDFAAGTVVASVDSVSEAAAKTPRARLRIAIVATALVLFLIFCGFFLYFGRPPLVIRGWSNTQANFFHTQHVTSYTLGTPTWGNDNKGNTITYPIQYQRNEKGTIQNCSGKITMYWDGFISGWTADHAEDTCSP